MCGNLITENRIFPHSVPNDPLLAGQLGITVLCDTNIVILNGLSPNFNFKHKNPPKKIFWDQFFNFVPYERIFWEDQGRSLKEIKFANSYECMSKKNQWTYVLIWNKSNHFKSHVDQPYQIIVFILAHKMHLNTRQSDDNWYFFKNICKVICAALLLHGYVEVVTIRPVLLKPLYLPLELRFVTL